jgi:hypothetical protein
MSCREVGLKAHERYEHFYLVIVAAAAQLGVALTPKYLGLRQISATGVPASACLSSPMICSSVNRDYFIDASNSPPIGELCDSVGLEIGEQVNFRGRRACRRSER